MEGVERSAKRGGKWTRMVDSLRSQTGPIVAARLDNARRLAADLPDREVYHLPAWKPTGLIATYAPGQLPRGAVRVTTDAG